MNYLERLKSSDRVLKHMLERTSKRLFQVKLVDGGSAGAIAVAGILKGDELIAVFRSVATDATWSTVTSEFRPQTNNGIVLKDGYIDNTGGTDTSGDKLLVIWVPWEDR